jgi:hypothetical protein
LKKNWQRGKMKKRNSEEMKIKSLKLVAAFVIVMTASCNEPETIVTNTVHTDGSVTRRVEMRNSENKFKFSSLQVPVDSTWTISDSMAVGEKGDTTWFRRAEKLFSSAEELNLSYRNDSSYNRGLFRNTEFRRRFKWFNTEYRFSENIGRTLAHGYPLGRFMNNEQLEWYYSPGPVNEKRILGADSIKYRALQDSVNSREEFWIMSSLCSEFIAEFAQLLENSNSDTLVAVKLKENEDSLIAYLKKWEDQKIDETWLADSILENFAGRGTSKIFSVETDSAINITVDKVLADFKEYSVRINMPGRLVKTNGFSDSSRLVLWPVRSEYFMSEPYEMWAVSRVSNSWAWIVSAVFVLFVITGIVVKTKKEG